MQELIDSYEARDFVRYSALFDQDSFVFVFDPVDVEKTPDIPPSWNWPEELSATRHMFESPLVERINLGFVLDLPREATEQDTLERSFPDGTMRVLVNAVELAVDTRNPLGGEHIIYRVAGDQAIFFLYPDSAVIADGVPTWKIFEWRDRRIGARHGLPLSGTLDASWGSIKQAYS